MTLKFHDMLYGEIRLPDWLESFLRLPEFSRLRGVRLSNVDSWQFKDFAGPTRWEHCVSVAYLATRCARHAGMTLSDTVHLVLAALLHDVATPPFAHTLEYVLPAFDHELESYTLLSGRAGIDADAETPVFAGQLPRFRDACESLQKSIGVAIDPDEVANMVVGGGKHGHLIHGSVDLDNADNVVRACFHMGIDVERDLPLRIADWLGSEYSSVRPATTKPLVVQQWEKSRDQLYGMFYNSTEQEIGRQAFLQHIMRRAIASGMPRRAMIWNSDERLLANIETLDSDEGYPNMIGEVVQRYRLLETPTLVFKLEIDTSEMWRSLTSPSALNWLEDMMTSASMEAMVFAAKKRFSQRPSSEGLFPSVGTIYVFKLGSTLTAEQLPKWLRAGVHSSQRTSFRAMRRSIHNCVHEMAREWGTMRPWQKLGKKRITNIKSHLDAIGNWDFRSVKNDTLHPYPATYVHAIPAAAITALELQGQTIVDPFGGTGQTAMEGIKRGCRVVTADINSVACLASRARLQFLSAEARRRLSKLSSESLLDRQPAKLPEFELQDKWFHEDTLSQLLQVLSYCKARRDPHVKDFLLASFSAILMQCTARRGKQHAYFADNTPLARGHGGPPRINAVDVFVERVQLNLKRVARLYAGLERTGFDPEKALAMATVKQLDATSSAPSKYGIKLGTADAIITSPPYLCMADYTLGNRLSYYFLFPESLPLEFKQELGARRRRPKKKNDLVAEKYSEGIRKFAQLAFKIIKHDGFLVTIVGGPTSRAFEHLDLVQEFESIVVDSGFEVFWTKWRPINWHRNQNFARLQKERIFVFRKK